MAFSARCIRAIGNAQNATLTSRNFLLSRTRTDWISFCAAIVTVKDANPSEAEEEALSGDKKNKNPQALRRGFLFDRIFYII